MRGLQRLEGGEKGARAHGARGARNGLDALAGKSRSLIGAGEERVARPRANAGLNVRARERDVDKLI